MGKTMKRRSWLGACAPVRSGGPPGRRAIEWLALAAKAHDDSTKLLLSPHAQHSLREHERPARGVVLLSGPEGGFEPEEERAAQRAGFIPVRLGSRVLRTETAAVAALAALQALWGDF